MDEFEPNLEDVLAQMSPLSRADFDRAVLVVVNARLQEEIAALREALKHLRNEIDSSQEA